MRTVLLLLPVIALSVAMGIPTAEMGSSNNQSSVRPRARDIGLKIEILPTVSLNALTDVPGVLVGQTTIVLGDNIRTGVTAILPHGGNMFREKVPGAVFVGNGFGK